MSKVRDPVCGMTIDSETAAAQSEYGGTTYFFCSTACKESFDADPARYTQTDILADSPPDSGLEHHEPRFTKSGESCRRNSDRPEVAARSTNAFPNSMIER